MICLEFISEIEHLTQILANSQYENLSTQEQCTHMITAFTSPALTYLLAQKHKTSQI
uniref:Uncharacterized protein n=1 Tax=Rhizophora mucronata TaxID=61149 RepID=A0A2P2QM88_RHIMU